MAEFRYRPPIPAHHRDILAVPESHTLYVCPPGCGRRHAIRALQNARAGSCSFYLLEDADVVSGDYESRLDDVVGDLFARLGKPPKVLTLCFNCIDDLLGTDEVALRNRLTCRFPATRFNISRFNPLSDDSNKPAGMQGGVYQLLQRSDACDGSVNVVGLFNALPQSSEFADVLRSWSVPSLRNVAQCRTYDEYEALADSSLNVVVSWMGEAAAESMLHNVGIPHMRWRTTYSPDSMMENYERLRCALGGAGKLCDTQLAQAQAAVRRARDALDGWTLVVDSLATFAPLELACNLLDAGFNVAAVFAMHLKADQGRPQARLAQCYPEVRVVLSAKDAKGSVNAGSRVLAIGHDAQVFANAVSCLDMFHDEGCFGFDGIVRLMDGLVAAAAHEGMTAAFEESQGREA